MYHTPACTCPPMKITLVRKEGQDYWVPVQPVEFNSDCPLHKLRDRKDTVSAELPAILYVAYLLDHFSSDEERIAYLEGRLSAPDFMLRWNELDPEQRQHWEAVAKSARDEFANGVGVVGIAPWRVRQEIVEAVLASSHRDGRQEVLTIAKQLFEWIKPTEDEARIGHVTGTEAQEPAESQ